VDMPALLPDGSVSRQSVSEVVAQLTATEGATPKARAEILTAAELTAEELTAEELTAEELTAEELSVGEHGDTAGTKEAP
jgi:hypothetical protein